TAGSLDDDSDDITLGAGAATQLAIVTQPAGGSSGSVLGTQPVVEVRDAQGNVVVSDDATEVTVASFSGDDGMLGGTATVTVVDGVATLTDVTLAGTVGEDYVLRFTSDPVLDSVDSQDVNVTVGTATQL